MSLVDYGSSDESDGESSPAGPPPPPPPPRHGLWSTQAPAAKRGDPVRISAPRLQDSSDSDEEEPAQKRRHESSGLGLTALLPQAKNFTVKETNRPLLPHVFTKRDKAAGKPSGGSSRLPVTPAPTPTPSPSAIKAASKSAAKQLARHIMNEEPSEEEGDEEVSFFSLPDSRPQSLPPGPRTDTLPSERPLIAPGPGAEELPELEDPLNPADAPLEFTRGAYAGGSHQGAALGRPPAGSDYGFTSPSSEHGQAYQEYFSDYNAAPAAAAAPEQEMQTFLNDEAFKRLQGKRNRGKEEVSFLEIKGDDQLSGSQQWLMKSITEEKDMKSFSKKRGDQPTSQQRRKHQITYLIHQAKERELELKNTWSDNRLTKRQTQAKYGF